MAHHSIDIDVGAGNCGDCCQYDCVMGSCVATGGGPYANLDECMEACGNACDCHTALEGIVVDDEFCVRLSSAECPVLDAFRIRVVVTEAEFRHVMEGNSTECCGNAVDCFTDCPPGNCVFGTVFTTVFCEDNESGLELIAGYITCTDTPLGRGATFVLVGMDDENQVVPLTWYCDGDGSPYAIGTGRLRVFEPYFGAGIGIDNCPCFVDGVVVNVRVDSSPTGGDCPPDTVTAPEDCDDPPVEYDCVEGSCAATADGAYATIAECEADCPQGYNCANGTDCVEAVGAFFPTLEDCEAHCPEPDSYNCVAGECEEAEAGSYATLAACLAVCQPPPPEPRYKCDGGGSCVRDDELGVFESLEECDEECEEAVGGDTTYDCDGEGSCPGTVGGSGPYLTHTECMAVCDPPPPPETWSCDDGDCVQDGGMFPTEAACRNSVCGAGTPDGDDVEFPAACCTSPTPELPNVFAVAFAVGEGAPNECLAEEFDAPWNSSLKAYTNSIFRCGHILTYYLWCDTGVGFRDRLYCGSVIVMDRIIGPVLCSDPFEHLQHFVPVGAGEGVGCDEVDGTMSIHIGGIG